MANLLIGFDFSRFFGGYFELNFGPGASRDKIFEYTVSLPSLPSIRNSIPLCQKVDSRILREMRKVY